MISPAFALGWAGHDKHGMAHTAAMLEDEILGIARAEEIRSDLLQSGIQAGGFLVLFNRDLNADEMARVSLRRLEDGYVLPALANLRTDRTSIQRIFVLGSPRSGTSELGATLQRVYHLPWEGEFHAAPLFAAPSAALQNAESAKTALARLLSAHRLDDAVVRLARLTYFGVHQSASFLDKTPGVPMIRSAPFLARCFPDAKFIYLRRNGISNVLSRMTKFGGDFAEHCADWAAALSEWERVREALPDYLELRQEDMLNAPDATAQYIAAYLQTPEATQALADSLGSGRMEQTGAGIGRTRLADTGWSLQQMERFVAISGPMMERFGYEM